nr:hypothetical protein [Tanacetum cinerariifolium]
QDTTCRRHPLSTTVSTATSPPPRCHQPPSPAITSSPTSTPSQPFHPYHHSRHAPPPSRSYPYAKHHKWACLVFVSKKRGAFGFVITAPKVTLIASSSSKSSSTKGDVLEGGGASSNFTLSDSSTFLVCLLRMM